jgi:carboxypeptidase D
MKHRPGGFFSELAANASAHNVSMVIYSGNDDALVAHRGTEGKFYSQNAL